MLRKPAPDFERYMTALHCKEPDRVPLGDWHVDQLCKEAFLGKKIKTLTDEVDFWYAAGFDYILSFSGIPTAIEASGGMTFKGDTVHTAYQQERAREWAIEHKGSITNWEEFEKYQWPSVDDFDLSKWDIFDKILPKGMKAILGLGRIFTPVWMTMGAETFFFSLENNEELVAAIFDKVGKIQLETLLRVIEHPCVGGVFNPDDVAHNSGPMINPRYLRKYLFPWYKKIGEICRQKNLGFAYHGDGDCSEVMDDLINCGFHGFNPVQPNAMDINEVKKKWGDKLCLIGNINLDSTLTTGNPEDVRAEVYERIRTIGPGGGYMVASSNSITDYVPLENMRALIDATFEFGQYPIKLKEGVIKGKIWIFKGKPQKERSQAAGKLDIKAYADGLLSNDVHLINGIVAKDIETGISFSDALTNGLTPAMALIGEKFQNGEIFIPEMMIAAAVLSKTILKFKNDLLIHGENKIGTVVIGTVKGDLHDIGKNLVTMMTESQGFRVFDLGISVSPEKFAEAVMDKKPDILAMSALLTTTMLEMRKTISALKEAGVRDRLKIIIGGAPVTQDYANQIGADGYAYDAPGAVKKMKELLGI
jgi:uroporphyrinogen decarboxylase